MSQFDRTLLERIEAAGTEQPAARASFDKSLLVTSVLRNVRRVLNERQGACETRPDFGLPDLNDSMGRGAAGPSQFATTVQETIELFEPRLSNVLVRFVPDTDHPMRINYRISAMLQVGEQRERVSFDTIMSEDKRIHVRG